MSSSKCYNGRINIIQPDTNQLFAMKDKIAYDSKTTEYREALNGNWQDSILSKAYFSEILYLVIINLIEYDEIKKSDMACIVKK